MPACLCTGRLLRSHSTARPDTCDGRSTISRALPQHRNAALSYAQVDTSGEHQSSEFPAAINDVPASLATSRMVIRPSPSHCYERFVSGMLCAVSLTHRRIARNSGIY